MTKRELNRATLARQMLLAREKVGIAKAIERLAGLQAQLARPPYIALWSRVAGFERTQLTRALSRREVVRATMMRGTLHLASGRDYRELRAALQPMLTQGIRVVLRQRGDGLDIRKGVAVARAFFEEQPRTFDALRDHFAEQFPKGDARGMAYAVRLTLPLVQVPDGGPWGFPGAADFAVAESWLGEPIGSEEKPQALVLRYLAAFGPATFQDMQSWSGLSGLRESFETLRPKLRVITDERGRELFDLPKAPRPDADVPAPVRFLPDYDNLVMAYAERSRLIDDAHRKILLRPNLLVPATFLVDGRIAGVWKIAAKKKVATLAMQTFAPLGKKVRDELSAEGEALLRFVEPEVPEVDVRFEK